jgi:hypothetical protein
MGPVSSISCVSWWAFLNSTDAHETVRWESGMRYQHQSTTSCGTTWPPATHHVVVSASQWLLVRYQRCRCPKLGHGPPDCCTDRRPPLTLRQPTGGTATTVRERARLVFGAHEHPTSSRSRAAIGGWPRRWTATFSDPASRTAAMATARSRVSATTTAHLVWILGPRLPEPADQAEAVPRPPWSPLRAVFAKGESRRGLSIFEGPTRVADPYPTKASDATAAT